MEKIIRIQDDGETISCDAALTNEEKIRLGCFLYGQDEEDNQGQILFYTGINRNDAIPPTVRSPKSCPPECDHRVTGCALSCYEERENHNG